MWSAIQKLLGIGNAGIGLIGVAAIAAPFLMQSNTTLSIPYPIVGVVLIFFGIYAEAARRTPY